MKTVPQPNVAKKQTGLRLRADFYRAIKVEAAKRDVSAAYLIQEGMISYLKLELPEVSSRVKGNRGAHAA